MNPKPDLLADLTDAQREAVLHGEGPLLVVAGPGSGKTRVITRRVAHLISERGVPPSAILAITFTNKAAQEMERRVHETCPAQGAWIRTFHSACAAILRRWPESAGLPQGFTIYDSDEQAKIVRAALKAMDVPTQTLRPGEALSAISHWKADGVTPEEALEQRWSPERHLRARVYERYVRALRDNGAVDFDDLLALALRALKEDEHVRTTLQERFRHVLIDEYQDTSPVQFQLARLLAEPSRNVCATGDPDQSIYAFRKADLRNILDFEEHYPGAKVVRLEHNFRSVATILRAADALIANNRSRRQKVLVPTRGEGEPVRVISAWTEREEAQQVAQEILAAYSRGTPYRDLAVFYRVNSQSRALEAALLREGIPYTIVKGVEFFQRAEVKDALAYLKVLANPRDRESTERVLSTPSRGIGKVSLARIAALAKERGWTARESIRKAADQAGLPQRASSALRAVAELLDTLERGGGTTVHELLEEVLRLVRFEAYLKDAYGEEAEERWQNLKELVEAARDYDEEHPEDTTLAGFLTHVGLVSDVDRYDPDAPRVPLMTLHSAKGLEFREVILTGVENGLLPHSRSVDDPEGLEEERRLFFVGITRAKERLTLTYATSRSVRMPGGPTGRSRFLDELPGDALDVDRDHGPASVPRGLGGDWSTYGDDPPSRSFGRRGGGYAASVDADVQFHPDVPPEDDPSAGLRVGGAVEHPVYGPGKVVRVDGRGTRARAVVRFRSVGEKTLALTYAKLTVLD